MLSLLRSKGRVLLLDDDAAMQRLVMLLLKRQGYRVDAVSKGNQAIEQLKARRYDAILLDLMMPHEGGVTVMAHLRQHDPAMLRRVVLVTGAPEQLLQNYRAEIFDVLRKPFDGSSLTAVVDRLTTA